MDVQCSWLPYCSSVGLPNRTAHSLTMFANCIKCNETGETQP